MVATKRVYEKHDKKDGYRTLVDRLWPRGISKARAHLNLWLKDIAPSTELRKWFAHDPKKWSEFKRKYRAELKKNKHLLAMLKEQEKKHGVVTLLYGARDEAHNEAVVVAAMLSRL